VLKLVPGAAHPTAVPNLSATVFDRLLDAGAANSRPIAIERRRVLHSQSPEPTSVAPGRWDAEPITVIGIGKILFVEDLHGKGHMSKAVGRLM
jgi:hypothetical protein